MGSINTGVLRLPADSDCLAGLLKHLLADEPTPPELMPRKRRHIRQGRAAGRTISYAEIDWGVSGPKALTWMLRQTGEDLHAQPQHVLYPIPAGRNWLFLRPDVPLGRIEKEDTLSAHLFNTVKGGLRGAQARPQEGCYIDRVCQRHAVDPNAFTIPGD